jgi:hypothetical protein
LPNQTIDQGGTLEVALAARAAVPGQSLIYSLDPGGPAGATIDSHTGDLTWQVPALQSPGEYLLTVRVTDEGSGPLSNSETVMILVNQRALPPKVVSVSAVPVKKRGTKTVEIFFNEPMNPSTAGAAGEYVVVIPEKVLSKKNHPPKSRPVAFSAQYNPANDSVSLILRKPAKRPLQVTVRKSVAAANGLTMGVDYTVPVQ